MREIKFRAWDIENDCWAGKDWELYLDLGGELWGRHGGGDWISVYELFKLSQYTDFKDKNKADIYDHDILKWRDSTIEVLWNDGSWQVRNIIVDDWWEFLNSDWSHEAEVIGNTYENPELVKL